MAHSSPSDQRRNPLNDHDLGEPTAKKQKASHEPQPSGRRQAACQACRLRKVKCDKKRPCCAICQASGATCEYPSDSTEKITLDAATHTILERLDALSQELDSVKQNQFHQNVPLASVDDAYSRQHPVGPHHDTPAMAPNPPPCSAYETSRDFLRIPPHRASADTILQWEIFQGRYAPNTLIGVLFAPGSSDHLPSSRRSSASPAPDLITSPLGLMPLDEEQIPALVDRFLTNVYTKNPILDVELLVKQRSVAKPFDRSRGTLITTKNDVSPATDQGGRTSTSSARMYAKELQQGDSCFTLACRRLGSLKYSMLGAQCHFFAGVYLMYTLRPIQSWHYFFQASIFTHFYLRMTHGLFESFAEVLSTPSQTLSFADRKARRIEQSLYWSCFKSECEFRVELPLPQSEISLGEYPQLFPSPPSPAPVRDGDAVSADRAVSSCSTRGDMGFGINPMDAAASTTLSDEELELRQHAMHLCNEEESWYYYLTEIALRRIGNRIINTFFPAEDPNRTSWLNIRPLLRMAQEFEAQQYETSSIIRAPHLNFTGDGARSHVSRELSWAIDNRLLEMQTWLYQPFLYYLIHAGLPRRDGRVTNGRTPNPTLGSRQAINNLLNPWSPGKNASSTHSVDFTGHPVQQSAGPGASAAAALDADDITVLESLIASGIDCSLKTIDVRACGHRHHGLWYDLRSIMSASLVLLAIVKSGNAAWIPGGAEALWGAQAEHSNVAGGGLRPIGGRMARVMAQFEFWAAEAPDMRSYRAVLEEVIRDVRVS